MLYSLLPSSPELPTPVGSKQYPFNRPATRFSTRRAAFLIATLFVLYSFSSGLSTHSADVVVVIQRTAPPPPPTTKTLCDNQLPSRLQPGGLIRFEGNTKASDNSYVPILSQRTYLNPVPRSEVDLGIPLDCLDDYISRGAPCYELPSEPQRLDVVWTYVNASDPIHIAAYKKNLELVDKVNPADYHAPPIQRKNVWREFDELHYSVRSVVSSFRQSARKLFVLTSDFPYPGCEEESEVVWRVGQVPNWLASQAKQDDESASTPWHDRDLPLHLVHHTDVFEPLGNRSRFNSYAIETRLAFVEGLGDNFVYLNDDMFFNKELSARDFYTREYGPVFRMQPHIQVGEPGYMRGEWVALLHTNDLLNGRFGTRTRPYMTHVAKALSVPFLRELHAIWSDELAITAAHPFRSYVQADPDIHIAYFQSHYVVERWREILLWSFVVGRIGAEDDSWGPQEASRTWGELRGMEGETTLKAKRRRRDTLAQLHGLQKSDPTMSTWETTYIFSSMDGYPYTGLMEFGGGSFPEFTDGDTEVPYPHPAMKCSLDLHECFKLPEGVTPSASEIFRNVAFRNPACGDCMITSLMAQSGPLGLEPFLPIQTRYFPELKEGVPVDSVPRLPLTPNWTMTDFALDAISSAGELTVREWVVQAMHRYRFILGDTAVTFAMLESPMSAKQHFQTLDVIQGTSNDPAIICINDDVQAHPSIVRKQFFEWMDERWPVAPEWEGAGSRLDKMGLRSSRSGEED